MKKLLINKCFYGISFPWYCYGLFVKNAEENAHNKRQVVLKMVIVGLEVVVRLAHDRL